MAAQLGTMTVSEEIAALEIMSIDPVRFLVMPRLVAMSVMTPVLSFYTCIMGVLGGAVVGATQLGVSWAAYMDNATRYADTKDLYVGLLKAFLFGIIITIVSCREGFATTQGAVGVGMAPAAGLPPLGGAFHVYQTFSVQVTMPPPPWSRTHSVSRVPTVGPRAGLVAAWPADAQIGDSRIITTTTMPIIQRPGRRRRESSRPAWIPSGLWFNLKSILTREPSRLRLGLR